MSQLPEQDVEYKSTIPNPRVRFDLWWRSFVLSALKRVYLPTSAQPVDLSALANFALDPATVAPYRAADHPGVDAAASAAAATAHLALHQEAAARLLEHFYLRTTAKYPDLASRGPDAVELADVSTLRAGYDLIATPLCPTPSALRAAFANLRFDPAQPLSFVQQAAYLIRTAPIEDQVVFETLSRLFRRVIPHLVPATYIAGAGATLFRNLKQQLQRIVQDATTFGTAM